jgi:uncharacterized protein involved in exopolysaccharide biosynthesis
MVRYIEILFRFKVRFAFLLLVIPATVGAVTILLFPSYSASAHLWVDDPGYFGGVTPTGWSQYLTPAQNETDGLNQLTLTHAFQADLYNALGDSIPDPSQRVAAIGNDKLAVIPIESHLILVSASCNRPPVCVVLVSKAIDVMRTEQIQSERQNAQAGLTYLTAQLQQAQAKQSQAEDNLRKYLASHPGSKVDNTDPTVIQDPALATLAANVQSARSATTDLQTQVDRDNSVVSTNISLIQTGPRVIDEATVGGAGLLGDRTVLRKAALFAGGAFALGLGYVFLLGWLDKTLRDPRDIERRFKVPVVTTIPELQPSERF